MSEKVFLRVGESPMVMMGMGWDDVDSEMLGCGWDTWDVALVQGEEVKDAQSQDVSPFDLLSYG